MTEQEQRDLYVLLAAIREKKLSTFDYLQAVTRYTETDLMHSGYRNKTIAQAMEMIMKDAIKAIDKLTAAHIRKYPDD